MSPDERAQKRRAIAEGVAARQGIPVEEADALCARIMGAVVRRFDLDAEHDRIRTTSTD